MSANNKNILSQMFRTKLIFYTLLNHHGWFKYIWLYRFEKMLLFIIIFFLFMSIKSCLYILYQSEGIYPHLCPLMTVNEMYSHIEMSFCKCSLYTLYVLNTYWDREDISPKMLHIFVNSFRSDFVHLIWTRPSLRFFHHACYLAPYTRKSSRCCNTSFWKLTSYTETRKEFEQIS